MKYKLAVFDMDGTILDTIDDLTDTLNFVLAARNMPTHSVGQVRSFVGNGIRRLVERGAPEHTDARTVELLFDEFNARYKEHCADRTRPYDGVPALLARLRAAGYMTAVVSNKADYAVQGLCAQFFDGLFDCAVGERDGLARKPAPDMVLHALARLGADKSEAVYIGDSEVDLETARNAQLPCVAVAWGFRDPPFLRRHGARTIAFDPSELERILLK